MLKVSKFSADCLKLSFTKVPLGIRQIGSFSAQVDQTKIDTLFILNRLNFLGNKMDRAEKADYPLESFYPHLFQQCWNAILNHRTSRLGDEYAVLAVMLSLDTGEISASPC
jgi:hypothetical protein